MEVTVKLLENAMKAALSEGRSREGWGEGRGRFLVDGFPRKMDQATMFDTQVGRLPDVLSCDIIGLNLYSIGVQVHRRFILQDYRGGYVGSVTGARQDERT